MDDVAMLLVKAAAAGLLVVAFALVGEAVDPKRFAGIFSAAPAVALGSLGVLAASSGRDEALEASRGMVAGAVAMAVAIGVAVVAWRGRSTRAASALLVTTWALLAAGGYAVALA